MRAEVGSEKFVFRSHPISFPIPNLISWCRRCRMDQFEFLAIPRRAVTIGTACEIWGDRRTAMCFVIRTWNFGSKTNSYRGISTNNNRRTARTYGLEYSGIYTPARLRFQFHRTRSRIKRSCIRVNGFNAWDWTMALMRGLRSLFVMGTNYAYKCTPTRVILARALFTMQPLSKKKEWVKKIKTMIVLSVRSNAREHQIVLVYNIW